MPWAGRVAKEHAHVNDSECNELVSISSRAEVVFTSELIGAGLEIGHDRITFGINDFDTGRLVNGAS